MPFSTLILLAVLSWTWLFERRVPDEAVWAIAAAVLALAAWHDARSGEWGFDRRAFGPGLGRTMLVTLPAVALILGAGLVLGTLHDRRDFLGSVTALALWGGAQQWVLQTVLLREAQRATSRRLGMLVAALLFGALHLPNPFLAPVTFASALLWCPIYDRYPNVLPLAGSHAIGTLAMLHAFDLDLMGRLRVGQSYLLLNP